MNVLRALLDAWLVAFWSLVVWEGGPRHHSYGHAVFAKWQAQQRLKGFLQGERHG